MKLNKSFGLKTVVFSFLTSVVLSTSASLFEPEPLLAFLRPENSKISMSSGFRLLSLDRNRLALANFKACFTFAFLLTLPFVVLRLFFVLLTVSFQSQTYEVKYGALIFYFYFLRSFFVWLKDLRNLPLQLIPPAPIRQGFFESGSFLVGAASDRRELAFALFLLGFGVIVGVKKVAFLPSF